MPNAMNPLPSLIRASAWDAGNASMRAGNRTVWNEDDYNASCETQERLITACYGRATDSDPRTKYIRFQIAGQLEAQGDFNLQSDCKAVMAWIDEYLADEWQIAA
jgi:hypothetical protein